MNVIEAAGLGKRYASTWALRECSVAIPAGHVAALVGPNGSGKTTLLTLAAGLAEPSAGGVTVLGGRPPGSPAALDGIAFVAQDTPLYKNLSVVDMLHLTRNLNRRFDQASAQTRLAELGIPLKRKAGRLSGGQQAQLALTLALARRPRLLVLDEPMAMLDPLARHDFMATVMTAMADDGVSVVLSSHVLAELERVADYLVDVVAGNGTSSRRGRGPAGLPPPAHRPRCRSREVCRTPERRARVERRNPGTSARQTQRDRPPGATRLGGASGRLGGAHPCLPARARRRGAARSHPRARRRTFGGDDMTTLTTRSVPVHLEEDESLQPLPWRRMAWVTWRQHRVALVGLAVLLGALAVYLWLQGRQLHHAYGIALACHPASSGACMNAINYFTSTYDLGAEDHPVAASSSPGDHRGVPRGSSAGPRAGNGHLSLRLDPGLRAVALDARQARVARSSRRGGR